jgi:alpha-galactosidase
MNRIYFYLILALFLFSIKQAEAVTIPYGKTGMINYDLKSGSFSISNNGRIVLRNGFSTANDHDILISSKDYKQRINYSSQITDSFGKGVKYTIIMRSKGMPDMVQYFYTYKNLPYFLTRLELRGNSILTNNMIPIQGEVVFFTPFSAVRSLSVPFDNDTFISYRSKLMNDGQQNISAEVGCLYDNLSRKGAAFGSVQHDHWKTGIKTKQSKSGTILLEIQAGYTEVGLTRDNIAHGMLKGASVQSPEIFFGEFSDWRTGMEQYAKANRLSEPREVFKWARATPVGWNSWGVMKDRISYEKVIKVSDFFADELKMFRSGGTVFIDLDSYWNSMLKGGLDGDYSQLKLFVDYAKKRGLSPGIYWGPFTDWGHGAGGDRPVLGSGYKYGDIWTKVGSGYHDLDGGRAIDPTHPGTQAHIAFVAKKLKECGFEMVKVDFLGHAAVESSAFYDPKVTTGMQAYKVGMEFLIKQLGDQMLIYGAISPSLASARYMHMRRIACDAFKSIGDTEYTLNSLTYGWWQTYLYDYIDADHVVFGDEAQGANHARLISALVTGTIILGDDYSLDGQWKARAKELLGKKDMLEVVKDGKSFKPIEGDTDKGASKMFIKQTKDGFHLAVFNYSDKPEDLKFNISRVGIKSDSGFGLLDLITSEKLPLENEMIISMRSADARIFKIYKEKKQNQ